MFHQLFDFWFFEAMMLFLFYVLCVGFSCFRVCFQSLCFCCTLASVHGGVRKRVLKHVLCHFARVHEHSHVPVCVRVRYKHVINLIRVTNICPTSPSVINRVDGLPPVSNLSYTRRPGKFSLWAEAV
jgi:hypothetical protein